MQFIAFNNGSNYDYHFIIKELAEEFRKQFTYLGEDSQRRPLHFQQREKLQKLIKMEKKSQKYILSITIY